MHSCECFCRMAARWKVWSCCLGALFPSKKLWAFQSSFLFNGCSTVQIFKREWSFAVFFFEKGCCSFSSIEKGYSFSSIEKIKLLSKLKSWKGNENNPTPQPRYLRSSYLSPLRFVSRYTRLDVIYNSSFETNGGRSMESSENPQEVTGNIIVSSFLFFFAKGMLLMFFNRKGKFLCKLKFLKGDENIPAPQPRYLGSS